MGRRWAIRSRFDGAIGGFGTASGTRGVAGIWPRSPFGSFADLMLENSAGHRTLVAPTEQIAEFISDTYCFDEILVEPIELRIEGPCWSLDAETVQVSFQMGPRPVLGRLLHAVPTVLTRSRWFATAADPVAARLLTGVRTRGTAGGGRREWYCASDLRQIIDGRVRRHGVELGGLRPVLPPVSFGFGSTPARPSLVRVLTQVADYPLTEPAGHGRLARITPPDGAPA